MMVEVGDPLPAGSRHIQIFYSVVEVHRDAVPEKGRVLFGNVGGRRIPQVPVRADLFEFIIERGCFARVQGIAELPYEICSLDQAPPQTPWLPWGWWKWNTGHLHG